MSLGRNDPCPCGSGKKYKKCCLLKDVEKKGPVVPDPAYRHLQTLMNRVDQRVERLIAVVSAAKKMGFLRNLENIPLLTAKQSDDLFEDSEFLEKWQAISKDMFCRSFRFEDGSSPYAQLLRNEGRFLPKEEQDVLQKLDGGKFGLFQVEDVFPEAGRLRLRDVIRETTVQVLDYSYSRSAVPFTLLLGHIHFFPEKEAFVLYALTRVAYPPVWKEKLLGQLDKARALLAKRGNTTHSVADMIHRFPYVLYWLDAWFWYHFTNKPMPDLRTKSGDPFVQVEVVYTCHDFDETLLALRKKPSLTEEVDETAPVSTAAEASFTWFDAEDSVLGSLTLTRRPCTLLLTATSRKNAAALKQKLKGMPHLFEMERREKPAAILMAEAKDEAKTKSGKKPSFLAPPFERGFPPEFIAKLQKKVIDDLFYQKIPQLENRSPLEAVNSPMLRSKVIAWLEELEHHYASGDAVLRQLNVDSLRRKLGL